MYAQFFGNYLLARKAITKEQFLFAMQKKSSGYMKLGTLAIHSGYMTAKEVDQVLILQTHQDKRFGELAIQEGYLTEVQVAELLKNQCPDFLALGQVLVDEDIIDNRTLQSLIIDYQSEFELYDLDYSDEAQAVTRQLIESFFVTTERSLSGFELSFLHLLLNNLIRFIGDDFTLATPFRCTEHPTNYCVSQKISGSFTNRIFLDLSESAALSFASRYAGEDFLEFDEYVQAAIGDFLNLQNGLFTVNLSNDMGLDAQLSPTIQESSELLTLGSEAYLLPVVYPFGTICFIFEVNYSV